MIVAGTIAAVVTPFTAGGAEVDLDLLDRHIAWLAEHGIRCIAPLGTNGEGPSLSLAERERVIEHLAGHPSGVALLPGTGCTSLPETIALSRLTVEHGAAGVLVPPPSYFPPERDGMLRWYATLVEALPSHARVFLYHIPRYTGVPVKVETVAALREAFGERVAGVKDSGRDSAYSIELLDAVPGLVVLNGSDGSVAEGYRAGAHGVVSALANCVPEAVERVRAAVAAGGTGEAEQEALNPIRELTQRYPQWAALKCLVHAVTGLPRSDVRPPLADLNDAEAVKLVEAFRAIPAPAGVLR
ncbi:MAG: dihydrodipicolinate synthase family protein [Gaiellaceae bacterium]